MLFMTFLIIFFIFQEKCAGYWPTDRSARYQYFVVDPLAEYNMPQYILREFKVTFYNFMMFLSFKGYISD